MFLLMDVDKNIVIFNDPKEIEEIMHLVRKHGFETVITNSSWTEMQSTLKKFFDEAKARKAEREGE